MSTPIWALAADYWLHMLATVLWIGGLTVLSLIVLPSAKKTLDGPTFTRFFDQIQRRPDPLGWLSIVVLIVSGMIQMSASDNYDGFLSFTGLWSGVILVKHILYGVMVVISGYVTWSLVPAIRRSELLLAVDKTAPTTDRHEERLHLFSQINFVLGIFVLLLTAIARAA